MKLTPRVTRMSLGIAIMIATGCSARSLAAQEADADWTPAEKARIGVLLQERCSVNEVMANRCDRAPVVTSVVVGGPADRAGIQAHDRLLTVNGIAVTTVEGRAALLTLEAGVPVDLDVARGGEETRVRVTPELRADEPYVDVRTSFFGPLTESAELSDVNERVRIVRIPAMRSRLDEVEVRLDSIRAHGNEFVFFHEDSEGSFKVEVGDPETAHVILERIREQEMRAEPLKVQEREFVEADGTRRVAITLGQLENLPEMSRFVWENEELAKRLAKVRNSSLRSARVHLDSLVRQYGRVQTMTEGDSIGFSFSITTRVDPNGGWAYYVGPRAVPSQLRTLLLTDLRVAGAEFRELQGDLAEYFDGADDGLLVLRVIGDTPASRLGLREGDVVIEVNGHRLGDVSSLRRAIGEAGPDGHLEVTWVRRGTEHAGRLETN